ncbi:MAG: Gfo/Idh/MocA family oxidoreductase, partial [Planctomycetota bacterium]
MTKKYNVGIIGYGWAATAHIAALNATSQGRVTAVWSSRPLDSAELTAKHGGPIKAYRELDALLAPGDPRRRHHELSEPAPRPGRRRRAGEEARDSR